MTSGLRLGRIAGIDIVADWSLLIIFTLIAFSLALGLFPLWHPQWSAALAWGTALTAAVLFFVSVLIHELSHAVVGRANGIRVPRITLFMFGGLAHMENEPRAWRAEFAMAIVGPLTSLALGVLFLWLAGTLTGPVELDPENPAAFLSSLGPLPTLLFWLGPVNILLGIFNLVPAFPLDGGRVLRAIVWAATKSLVTATRWASRIGQGFAWLLMATGIAMMLGMRVPFFGAGLLNGLWLAFIGWFLNNAAMVSYRQLLVRESLEGTPVSRLMQTQFTRIDPQMRVSTLVDQYIMASGQRVFPVEQDGRFEGIVCLVDIRKRSRDVWEQTRVRDIMTPRSALASVAPQLDAAEALETLGSRDVNQVPVVDGDKLVGLLRREDIVKWLSLRSGSEIDQRVVEQGV